jgi:hypothetical protein
VFVTNEYKSADEITLILLRPHIRATPVLGIRYPAPMATGRVSDSACDAVSRRLRFLPKPGCILIASGLKYRDVNPNSSLHTAMTSIVLHTLAQAVVMTVLLVVFFGLHYLLLTLAPEAAYSEVLAQILRWGVFATITLFAISVTVGIIISISRSMNGGPARRGNWLSTIDASSYAAGFITLFVVFNLLSRAAATENAVAKTLIYLATIGLVFEVGLMAYVQVKRSVSSTSVNQQAEEGLLNG